MSSFFGGGKKEVLEDKGCYRGRCFGVLMNGQTPLTATGGFNILSSDLPACLALQCKLLVGEGWGEKKLGRKSCRVVTDDELMGRGLIGLTRGTSRWQTHHHLSLPWAKTSSNVGAAVRWRTAGRAGAQPPTAGYDVAACGGPRCGVACGSAAGGAAGNGCCPR